MLDIKIKYVTDIKPIEVSENGDWIDLRAGKTIELEPFEFAYIPLGVCMELPEGYTAIIAPRSSTYKKWGIIQVNSIGIIDESYNGDNDQWCLPVMAFRTTKIYKNDRICQFRIMEHQPIIEFQEVDALEGVNRGGIGSTGKICTQIADKYISKGHTCVVAYGRGTVPCKYKEIAKRNFIAGIFRGVGFGIGVTIITAIIIYILQKLVRLNLPWIGKFINDIVEIVEELNR